MKLRHTIIFAISALLLTACNFTLAADVTPPPGYIPPTPAPTLGPLFPASAPDIHNGAKIYVEKCLPCHGATGLGDGEQGKQLPVKVAVLGLPDFARNAVPSAWYTMVTQGNIERFMPPFASLNDQERWDVVAYALFIHMTPEQIEKGKTIFESSCADCAKYFSDSKTMSALSENDLITIIKNGKDEIPAFGKDLTDEDSAAVAIYLRTLTFSAPSAALQATAAPEAAATLEAGTPSALETPLATQASTAGTGNVSGSVENQTGAELPSDTVITLRIYDHGGDPNAGPTEIASFETALNANGTYAFEDMVILENRIFITEVKVNNSVYSSDFAVVEKGMVEIVLKPIVIFATTEDFSVLKITSVQFFFDFANEGGGQVFAVYSILNDSGKTVIINMSDKKTVPFISFPNGATELGYEASQDSAPFQQIENGFAMPPSEIPYGLIAFASIPKQSELLITQTMRLPVDTVTLYLPEGMEAQGKTLIDGGIQPTQGMNFRVYTSGKVEKDASIEFTLTGEPSTPTAVNPDITQNKNLLIGVGALGIVLILLGAWLFIRDRKKVDDNEDDNEDDDMDDSESIMDAILALDDLHRAGKLSDAAYKQRREELKNALKRK